LAKYGVKHTAESTCGNVVLATEREHREAPIHAPKEIVHVTSFGGGLVVLADCKEKDETGIEYGASESYISDVCARAENGKCKIRRG
jgi:hypothetical protein